MADFVAVLKKTIDGLGGATPEMRARVYDKARATISAKLAAITPTPAPTVVERQKRVLEDAITSIEAEYAAAEKKTAEPVEDLESVVESLAAPPPPYQPAAKPPVAANGRTEPADANPDFNAPDARASDVPPDDSPGGAPAQPKTASRGRNGGRIAVALIALVFAGSAAYAVWLNRDEVSAMLGLGPTVATAPEAPAAPAPAEDVAAAPPTPVAPAPAVEPDQPAPPKFTQRLNPDGSEIDPGPAGDAASIGEGTSVAAVTVPPPDAPAASADAAPPATPDATPDGAPAAATQPADTAAPASPATPAAPSTASAPAAQPAVAIGQRAIFYEERTTADQGSAEQGNIVWSLVQESPGNDLPPEPAIRAEATIPGKDLQLRMTIRRNADPTLPASHIVELIFLTPENFPGGVIDNVLRMTMKDTEEATGNPVLGLPAKIGDGFFLIALADSGPEVEANLQLFRRMKWIDIPIVYRSGRRALMTMERGIPGDKVFEEAVKAWAAKSG